ncbi:MAG: PAS domain-containing protein [Rhodospirillaceae bacterium]|nr:PAS domain-containing protein [Rhodospirillaceae bacterium]
MRESIRRLSASAAILAAAMVALMLTGLVTPLGAALSWVAALAVIVLLLRPGDKQESTAEPTDQTETPQVSGARENELSAMLDGLPDPVLLVDEQAKIISANRAARDRFGNNLPGHDLSGRDLSVAIRHPVVIEAARDAINTTTGSEIEIELGGANGPIHRVRAEPLEQTALLLFTDITEIRRVERMRADFVANVSHELRTPLTTLAGFIETLRGPARDDAEARARFLDIMETEAARMTRLVGDLLSLSQIEANVHQAPPDLLQIGPVLEQISSTLEPEVARKSMTIQLNITSDLPKVPGDADELAQVAQNLIENAIKYGRDGTEITVKAWLEPSPPPHFPTPGVSALAISVQDQGDGIAREHLPRLTERFYRVDTARSRNLGGTGLGLAIVKHIVTRHRGALGIESRPGEGSEFTVYLPLAK